MMIDKKYITITERDDFFINIDYDDGTLFANIDVPKPIVQDDALMDSFIEQWITKCKKEHGLL